MGDDRQYGFGRVFGTYRELGGEPGIAIFREMQEALGWLSLSAESEGLSVFGSYWREHRGRG